MPKNKKLQNKIAKKLAQLLELLNQIQEASIMDSQDPETWDSDTLYDLGEKLKEALTLLENSTEEDLCSLVDEYHSESEEED